MNIIPKIWKYFIIFKSDLVSFRNSIQYGWVLNESKHNERVVVVYVYLLVLLTQNASPLVINQIYFIFFVCGDMKLYVLGIEYEREK